MDRFWLNHVSDSNLPPSKPPSVKCYQIIAAREQRLQKQCSVCFYIIFKRLYFEYNRIQPMYMEQRIGGFSREFLRFYSKYYISLEFFNVISEGFFVLGIDDFNNYWYYNA